MIVLSNVTNPGRCSCVEVVYGLAAVAPRSKWQLQCTPTEGEKLLERTMFQKVQPQLRLNFGPPPRGQNCVVRALRKKGISTRHRLPHCLAACDEADHGYASVSGGYPIDTVVVVR